MEKYLPKRQEGMKSKAQREGLGLNKRRDPSVVVEEWSGRQWVLMREGSKDGYGMDVGIFLRNARKLRDFPSAGVYLCEVGDRSVTLCKG